MRALLLFVTALTLGCEPALGIELSGTRSNLQIAFRDCRNGSKLGVNHISIIDQVAKSPEGAAHEVCELRPPVGAVSRITEWKYGTRAPGYAVLGCAPLETDVVYTVVIARPYGTRQFRIASDSRIEPLDPVCPP